MRGIIFSVTIVLEVIMTGLSGNAQPVISFTADAPTLSVEWPDVGATLRAPGPRLAIDDTFLAPTAAQWSQQGDDLFAIFDFEAPVRLELVVRAPYEPRQLVISARVLNIGDRSITVRDIRLLADARLSLGTIGDGDNAPTVYVDSGSQGGTHVARLDAPRSCRGICAVYNPVAELSAVCAFLSFEHDNTVAVAPAEGAIAIDAVTTTPIELAPGKAHEYDPVLLDCRRSPYEALERYADAVKTYVNPPIPDEMPCGWLSWYGYRLTMTEDTILENAAVIARHLRKYGVTIIQPDHGWQDRDICGNWVVNEKFPHGMPWLRHRLAEMGFELGLWAAPSVVSEFAPLVAEHPEALIRDAEGNPVVCHQRWTWPPHGRTYLIDPWTPAGEAFLREFADLMHEYGITYLKADFIGGWNGARTLRHGMGILREALGPDIILRPCSTALNTQLGICNEIGIARDIGNASGNWQHMRVETLELASKWFMHGRFWLNNPDSLIVGDPNESLGEAIGRVTMHALTGGVMFLADRMPELEAQPERLALVPLILPSSGMPARPIDLFRIGVDGRDYPRLWHLHADAGWGEWEVLGIINWSDEPLRETVRLGDLGLSAGEDYLVWDFWRGELAGLIDDNFEVAVPPGTARCLRIMPLSDAPAVLSTDMHVTQGLVELRDVRWDPDALTLSGTAVRAPGASGAIAIYLPPGFAPADGPSVRPAGPHCVWLDLEFTEGSVQWSIRFRRAEGGGTIPGPADAVLLDASMPAWPR